MSYADSPESVEVERQVPEAVDRCREIVHSMEAGGRPAGGRAVPPAPAAGGQTRYKNV